MAYLDDPRSVFGERAFAMPVAVARRRDLDYCGADCTVLPDGLVLLFEANVTMLVDPEAEDGVTARKNLCVAGIFARFDEFVR